MNRVLKNPTWQEADGLNLGQPRTNPVSSRVKGLILGSPEYKSAPWPLGLHLHIVLFLILERMMQMRKPCHNRKQSMPRDD